MHPFICSMSTGLFVTIVRVSRVDALFHLCYLHWLLGYYNPGQSGRCTLSPVLSPLACSLPLEPGEGAQNVSQCVYLETQKQIVEHSRFNSSKMHQSAQGEHLCLDGEGAGGGRGWGRWWWWWWRGGGEV